MTIYEKIKTTSLFRADHRKVFGVLKARSAKGAVHYLRVEDVDFRDKLFPTGLKLHHVRFIRCKFDRATLFEMELHNCYFSDCHLEHTSISRCMLKNVTFSTGNRNDVSNLRFSVSELQNCIWEGSINDVIFHKSRLTFNIFRGTVGSDCYFRDTVLLGCEGLRYCQIAWDNHGECGRIITGWRSGKKIMFSCGCFHGTLDALEKYINGGRLGSRVTRTRRQAMGAILTLLGYKK